MTSQPALIGTPESQFGQRFTGKIAMVTGGGSGIGAATAQRLAAEGAKVAVTGRRSEPLQKVAKDIDGLAIAADTADANAMAAAVEKVVATYGGLDVLIVSAGVAMFGKTEDVSLETWRENFGINIDGAMLACKYAIPAMRRRGGGSIVLVASMAALTGGNASAPYFASKAAMLGLNRSIAADYGKEGIRCNTICPGWAPTDMSLLTLQTLIESKGGNFNETVSDSLKAVPLGRMGDTREMAAAIAFLASSDASFITGTYLIADGGANIIDGSIVPLLD